MSHTPRISHVPGPSSVALVAFPRFDQFADTLIDKSTGRDLGHEPGTGPRLGRLVNGE